MYPNANNSHTFVPSFDNLMVDPFSVCSSCADKDHCAGTSVHLICNPLLYGLVAARFDRFPIIVFRRFVAFDNTDVSDLRRALVVWLVMKTVKDVSLHRIGHFS